MYTNYCNKGRIANKIIDVDKIIDDIYDVYVGREIYNYFTSYWDANNYRQKYIILMDVNDGDAGHIYDLKL